MLVFFAVAVFLIAVLTAMTTHRATSSEQVAGTFAQAKGVGSTEMVRQGFAAAAPIR